MKSISYSISDEEKDRINIIKVICIILVVYLHSYQKGLNFKDTSIAVVLPKWLMLLENGLSQVVAQCAVPLLFLISAILLFKVNRKWVPTIKKKIKTIVVPYLIWNTFWVLIFVALQNINSTVSSSPRIRVDF